MKMRILLLSVVSLFVTLSKLSAATYYVDFVGGSDANAGTSAGAAWQHCPGDTNATGVAGMATLAAGSKVIFKGSVEYPGQIPCKWSGAAGNPITYDGNTAGTFGTGPATFSGAMHIAAASWTRCTSSAMAYGAPDWTNCYLYTIPGGITYNEPFQVNLYYDGNEGALARMPNAADNNWWDDMTYYATSPSGNTSTSINLTAGFPVLSSWTGAYVGIHNNQNLIALTPITSTTNSGATINFATVGLAAPPAATFCIFNHPSLLDVRGEYALVNGGTQIEFYAGSGGAVPTDTQISLRGYGLNLNNKSYITVQGLTFQNYVAASLSDLRSGEGICAWSTGGARLTNILIQNCAFNYNQCIGGHNGSVSLVNADDTTINDCTFYQNQGNRGAYFGGVGGGPQNPTVTNCTFDRNGYAATDFYAANGGIFENNFINHNQGLHANGISIYLGCTNTTLRYNTFLNGHIGITLQSASTADVSYNVIEQSLDPASIGGTCLAIWPPTSTHSDSITIRNNTLQYGTAETRWSSLICNDSGATNLSIYNNILDGSGVPTTFAGIIKYQNDVYTHLDPTNQSHWTETNYINATGLNVFVNASAFNYQLVGGSPAIDAGISWGQTEDILGNPIIDAPDAGAYEYQAVRNYLSGGQNHGVAVDGTGAVWTWGLNSNGQLGNGTTTSTNTPTVISGISSVNSVVAGESFTVALKSDGTVWTWGANNYGQLGLGTTTGTNTPTQVPGLTGVVAIGAGYYHTMAVKSDGSLWVWGQNTFSQLGIGAGGGSYKTSPTQVTGISNVSKVTGGINFTLAVKSDGTLWSWGYNTNGQLGNNSTTASNVPIQVTSLSNVSAIACGSSHALAVVGGAVYGWGNNSNGQVGDGTLTNRLVPTLVSGVSGVTKVAGGNIYSKAITSSGAIYGWGSNADGQLADGTQIDHYTPEQISAFTGADIAACEFTTLNVKSDSTVWDSGYNVYGAVGDGTNTLRKNLVQAINGVNTQ